jgi:hypothetical protein
VGVRAYGRDPIALADTQFREPRRPSIAPLAKLRVRESQLAVDDGKAGAVKLAGAAREVQRSERSFHGRAFGVRYFSFRR